MYSGVTNKMYIWGNETSVSIYNILWHEMLPERSNMKYKI